MKITRFFLFVLLLGLFCTVPSLPSEAVSPGLYEISNSAGSTYVLEAKTCTVTDTEYHTLQLFDRLDVNQQKFYLEEMPGPSYRLSVVSTGEALTVSETEEGTETLLLSELRRDASPDTRKVQTFLLTDAGDGNFYIQDRDGAYLTLDDSCAHRGSALVLGPFTGRANQKWQLNHTWISATDSADTDLFNPYAEGGKYENLVLSIKTGIMLDRLTASEISSWVSFPEEEHALILSEESLTSYVQGLADEYNTVGMPREFTTTAGETITITEGSYGWKMNVEDTVERLREAICQNGSVTMEAVWDSTGAILTEEKEDMIDSYIEVDLTNQKVWLYKDGQLLIESDCVSGTYQDESRRTPAGIYSIFYKQSPAVLTGPDYSSPVTYWMAFNGNIGLHDASWRYEFGGEIFQYSGSHGCINLPYSVAETLYENTAIGSIVVLYY